MRRADIKSTIEANLPEGWVVLPASDGEIFWPRVLGSNRGEVRDILLKQSEKGQRNLIAAMTLPADCEKVTPEMVARTVAEAVRDGLAYQARHAHTDKCDLPSCSCHFWVRPISTSQQKVA